MQMTQQLIWCTSQNEQTLASSLSSYLALVAQRGNVWLVNFNTSKRKLIPFHPQRADPESSPTMMDGCSLLVLNERLLRLNLNPQTSNGTYKDPLLKILREWSVHCTTPVTHCYTQKRDQTQYGLLQP